MTPKGCHPLSKVDNSTRILLMQVNNIIGNFQLPPPRPSNIGWRRPVKNTNLHNKKDCQQTVFFINRQLPILPGRLQPSTFGVYVLNYCVRNGNRWYHIAIITGYTIFLKTFFNVPPKLNRNKNHLSKRLS